MSEKLQVANLASTAFLAHLKRHMKSNLRIYVQTIFEKVKERTEAYHVDIECDFSSLGLALTQHIQGMCDHISRRLDRVCPDGSVSGESPSH